MNNDYPSLQEKLVIALPWVFLPLLALHFVGTWSVLPARIAVHFDLHGRPNGWQSPETFASFAFVFFTIGLAILTFAMLRAFRLRSLFLLCVTISYFVLGMSFVLFWQTLDHAAFLRPMSDVWPVPIVFPLAALISAALLLAQSPSQSLTPSPHATIIAQEQHRSLLQLILVVPGVLIGLWLATQPVGGIRVLGIVLAAIMAWVAVAVLDGFRYFVRTDGVQIKGFLMPLRFIPRSSIRGYQKDRWKGLGYGIRLTSTGTAYIWGGRDMVKIATDAGDVMLGHDHPERLIQDLDRMMQATR
jgi:hypothetical protein